jgi:hypothetical protein
MLRLNEANLFKLLDVLGNCGLGDAESLAKLVDIFRAVSEESSDFKARFLSERSKNLNRTIGWNLKYMGFRFRLHCLLRIV